MTISEIHPGVRSVPFSCDVYDTVNDTYWYRADELDIPPDPTVEKPKRVEIVIETRAVIKEVVIRLPYEQAKKLSEASVLANPCWVELCQELRAALESEARCD